MSLGAFLAVLGSAGFRPGAAAPDPGVLATASGSAVLAVVIGQTATALCCRSSSRPAWQVRLRDNPLLLGALAATWSVVALLLLVPALKGLLGHALPPPLGVAIAACAFPAVLLVDAVHKRLVPARLTT